MPPRLTPVKRHKLCAVLRRNGPREYPARGKGGHTWFEHPDHPEKHTVVPRYDEVSPRLLSVILRQAGKSRSEYQQQPRHV